MKYRKLRIAWSVGWGIICLLLIALSVRSYWWHNSITYWSGTSIFGVGARQGVLAFEKNRGGNAAGWRIGNTPITGKRPGPPDFYLVDHPMAIGFGMPLWFPVLVLAMLTMAPWIAWSKHYSVRTLLIAMTLVAVVLGLVIWAAS